MKPSEMRNLKAHLEGGSVRVNGGPLFRLSASFEDDAGNSYHVWLDAQNPSRILDDTFRHLPRSKGSAHVLYMNPPRGEGGNRPRTSHFDADSARWKPVVTALLNWVSAEGYAAARAEYERKQAEQDAQDKVWAREERISKAAPKMHALLLQFRKLYTNWHDPRVGTSPTEWKAHNEQIQLVLDSIEKGDT